MEDKYLHYTAEELAMDADFIDFIRQKSPKQSKWRQWIEKNPRTSPTIEEARLLVQSISFSESKISSIKKDKIWKGINQGIEQKTTTRTFRMYRIAAAASVLLIMGYFLLKPGVSEIENMDLVAMNFELPDQSDVSLESNSKIFYNKKKFSSERKLKLEGEAFFEVEKGSSFIVETDMGSVEVLGTGFKVRSAGGKFEVACEHGKVRVNSPGYNSVILIEGESVYLDIQKGLIKREAESKLTNIFSFKNKPIIEVMKEVEKYYDVNISFEIDVEQIPLSGTFLKGDLDSTLQAICWPLQLDFIKLDEQTIQITK